MFPRREIYFPSRHSEWRLARAFVDGSVWPAHHEILYSSWQIKNIHPLSPLCNTPDPSPTATDFKWFPVSCCGIKASIIWFGLGIAAPHNARFYRHAERKQIPFLHFEHECDFTDGLNPGMRAYILHEYLLALITDLLASLCSKRNKQLQYVWIFGGAGILTCSRSQKSLCIFNPNSKKQES